MTSLPISSKTKTFHTAPSVDAFVASLLGSSCASTSVMGAFRFSMRFMLATRRISAMFATCKKMRATYLLVPECDGHGCVNTDWHPPLRRLPHAKCRKCVRKKTLWLDCLPTARIHFASSSLFGDARACARPRLVSAIRALAPPPA
jgi:hypothetical protein